MYNSVLIYGICLQLNKHFDIGEAMIIDQLITVYISWAFFITKSIQTAKLSWLAVDLHRFINKPTPHQYKLSPVVCVQHCLI